MGITPIPMISAGKKGSEKASQSPLILAQKFRFGKE